MYSLSKEDRRELGLRGREHVEKNYNFENFCQSWVQLMDSVYERYGSWENRKGHESWKFLEVA